MTHPAPQGLEGSLPPCLRLAVFEGHQAAFLDRGACGNCHRFPKRFGVAFGISGAREPWAHHPEFLIPNGKILERWDTDDPDEAEALWLEACERLRELP